MKTDTTGKMHESKVGIQFFNSHALPDNNVVVMRAVRDCFRDATGRQDTSVKWTFTLEIGFDEQVNNYSCGFYVLCTKRMVSCTCLSEIPEVIFEGDKVDRKGETVREVCKHLYKTTAVKECEPAGKDADMNCVIETMVHTKELKACVRTGNYVTMSCMLKPMVHKNEENEGAPREIKNQEQDTSCR